MVYHWNLQHFPQRVYLCFSCDFQDNTSIMTLNSVHWLVLIINAVCLLRYRNWILMLAYSDELNTRTSESYKVIQCKDVLNVISELCGKQLSSNNLWRAINWTSCRQPQPLTFVLKSQFLIWAVYLSRISVSLTLFLHCPALSERSNSRQWHWPSECVCLFQKQPWPEGLLIKVKPTDSEARGWHSSRQCNVSANACFVQSS
jgi:hypothetical protein